MYLLKGEGIFKTYNASSGIEFSKKGFFDEDKNQTYPHPLDIHKSLSAYLFLNSGPKLGRPKELILMEVQVKRVFKRYSFFYHNNNNINNTKADGPFMKFVQPLIRVCNSYFNPVFQNQHPLYSAAPFFPKNIWILMSGSIKWWTKLALITTLVLQD